MQWLLQLKLTLPFRDRYALRGSGLLDDTMLNAVLVLMLATSVLGRVLTERFAPRILESPMRRRSATIG